MSLKKEDLKFMMHEIFEIDSYASKMGSDEEIVTLSFSLKEKDPAKDLVKFIESGYNFVLDADITAGEQHDGTYKVFVEIERDRHIAENVFELLDGIKKLSGVNNYKFRYYKSFKSNDATLENLNETIPKNSNEYSLKKNQATFENYKNFFSDSYLESVDMDDDTIVLNKQFSQPIKLKFIDFGKSKNILENLKESYNPWDFAEIIFLSKYIGDYNITKYGNHLTFEKNGNTLVADRL